MRVSGIRRAVTIATTVTVVGAVFIGAAASAATIFSGALQDQLGSSFPDPVTWTLMLASFGMIGAGVRARKRFVVIA